VEAMKYHGRRDFLNLPGHHTNAAITVIVEDTADKKLEFDKYVNKYDLEPKVQFSISNCDRSLDWEIDWGTSEERENSLHKLDVMIDALQKFRDGVALEQQRYIARRDEFESRKAAKESSDEPVEVDDAEGSGPCEPSREAPWEGSD
jgi:hypothetical protein